MNHFTPGRLGWAFLIGLAACVKTEIVPEVLEPKLTVSPAALSLRVDETAQLQAAYTDSAGEDQSDAVVWQSSDAAVVTVSAAGLAAGRMPGQAWAVAQAPGGLADSVLITVVQDDQSVARVEIQNAPASLVVGASAALTAKAFNAANQELNGLAFSWASSDPAVLQIDAGGQITGLSAGTASITATANGVGSLPATVQVLPAGGLTRTGQFSGNSGYSVKGTATLEQTTSGLRLLLANDFMASNGPMLGVYLARTASGGLNSQNSLKLANLTANTGAQEYAVPPGVGLQDYDYVVIYCIPFNVRFGTAMLSN